ncbi:hypothetical protein [Anatilimnocola floriformis]|uniref:hypothetical protein n=1 Tax=Anatilimnocola floriformis TaxID=2948575 RepID=UPI0020C3ED5E|nr:hypothetical protein [Anatilimnocola floriformis]
MYYQQPGVFVQPPATGTVQGPIEQTTVEGAELSFPELRLRMPSLRMPTVSRSRQNARMVLDQAHAPFVESPPVAAMPAAPAAAPMAAPAAAPMMAAAPMAAPQMMMAPAAAPQMQMMMAPAAAPQVMMAPAAAPQMMMMAPVQMAPQQYYIPQQAPTPQAQPQQNPVQPMQAPQPEPDYSPRQYSPQPCPPQPTCDARGNPIAYNAAEEKIRQLEVAEQQLKQRMESLRRQLEQIELTKRPPTPTPDLGARSIQLTPTQQLRPTGVQPVSQPIAPPVKQPTAAQPAPAGQRVYEARPATYISEPQYLPQYQQPQQSQVIREPQAPTATIVGLRTR